MISSDRILGLLLAALVVLSMVPAAAAGTIGSQAQQPNQAADSTDDDLGPADEIYVRNNGSAVLVYEESSNEYDETDQNAEYGADISSNLFYLLVTEPVEGDSDVKGQGSLLLTESNVSGDGRLSFDQPESLSSLSFQVTGESTNENAASNLSLDATFDSEETSGSEQFESASTTGNVTVTPSNFAANGEFEAQSERSLGSAQAGSASFALTEDGGDYTVTVERNNTLSSFETDEWSTRERARATIEEQFSTTASEFDGTAEVTIQRYEFTPTERESARLDIAYTVEYTDIEAGVTEQLAQDIAQSDDIEMDSEQAQDVTARMEALTIERISAGYEVTSDSVAAEFDADVRNYDEVVLAAVDIAEATDTEDVDADELATLEQLSNRIEAQQAADLRQQMTWRATVTKPSPGEVAVTADASYTTDNWDDYVTELEDRDVVFYERRYEASATTNDDGRVNATGSMLVEGDIIGRLSSQMMSASSGDESDQQVLRAVLQAEPQRGQVNVSSDGGTVRIEAGAQFRNLSALRDALAENGTVPAGLTSVVGRTGDDGSLATYVTVHNAVGTDASESDVRALSYVDEETTVHMPDEWDREFPSMDTQRAASFLGVSTSANDRGTSSGSGPGFGVGVALVALVGTALLARRRT
jgi:PGF-CTERM protein